MKGVDFTEDTPAGDLYLFIGGLDDVFIERQHADALSWAWGIHMDGKAHMVFCLHGGKTDVNHVVTQIEA